MPTLEQIREYTQKAEEPTSPTPVTPPVEPAPIIEPTAEEEVLDTPLGEEAEEASGEEAKEELVKYFNELPDAMEWDPKQFYDLKLKTDSGEEYTFGEIKDALQTSKQQTADLDKRAEELQRREQEFYSTTQQGVEPATQEVQAAQQTLDAIGQAYAATTEQLEQYRQAGETEGMVAMQAELVRLQHLANQADAQLKGAQHQQQQIQQQAILRYKGEQFNILKAKIPEFKTEESFKEFQPKMRTYLMEQGIRSDEIKKLMDARVIGLFYKAMKYDQHSQQVSDVVDDIKGKTVRRIVKGATVPTAAATAREDAAKLISTAKASRREPDRKLARRAIAKRAGLL